MYIVNGRLSRLAPNLTSGLIFGFDVGWRAAHIVIMIGIVLALMPTYAWFCSFPRSCVGMHTEFEP
ncbi:hypothetical protein BZG76_05345 [Salinivibrio sp. AR647]|nr:hypothetical protein BZG76_05345 [Salinivibrio sp. AR647]